MWNLYENKGRINFKNVKNELTKLFFFLTRTPILFIFNNVQQSCHITYKSSKIKSN